MLTLIEDIFENVDDKTARILSASLIFFGLVHIAPEMKLTFEKMEDDFENLRIVACSNGWQQRIGIPSPEILHHNSTENPEESMDY